MDGRAGDERAKPCTRCGAIDWKLVKVTRSEIWNPAFRNYETIGRHYECQKCKRIEVENTQERIEGT